MPTLPVRRREESDDEQEQQQQQHRFRWVGSGRYGNAVLIIERRDLERRIWWQRSISHYDALSLRVD